jgi:acyl-CoA-binding protein
MLSQYPEKFYKAKDFVKHLHREGRELSDESQLVLYALGRQVNDGACSEAKPSAWNARERALWQAWDHLGQMSKEEAMRLYVKQLEIDVPRWWSQLSEVEEGNQGEAAAGAGGVATGESSGLLGPRIDILEHKTEPGKPSPKPRYEHGSLCVGSNMYVIGGRSGGRYLNDCWVFNLKLRTWAEKKWKEVDQSNKMAFLPALASASYLHSSGLKCVVVGGHTKPDHRTQDMKVGGWQFFDNLFFYLF